MGNRAVVVFLVLLKYLELTLVLSLTVAPAILVTCKDGTLCPKNSVCNETSPMIYCTCKPGFSYSGKGTTFIGIKGSCDDVNECLIASTCPKRATCVNTIGSFYCTCKAGFAVASGEIRFTNSSLTCEAIDECYQNPAVCGPYTICTSKGNGRHECSCSEGFSPTDGVWITGRTKCTDIDECRKISSCPERSSCQNTNGSFNCICDSGYSWWNQTGRGECLDIDECAHSSTHCGPYSVCTNKQGSYSCKCMPGFSHSRNLKNSTIFCTDIDECVLTPRACGPNTICINTPGNYSCGCMPGFIPSAEGEQTNRTIICTDIDECARSSTTCGPHSICTNTPGNYSCRCMPGFSDSRTRSLQNSTIFCTDIDECTQTPSACGPHTICTNTPGNYSCRCLPGFFFSAEGEQTNGTINCTEVTLNCDSEKMKACQNRSNQDPFCSLLGATYGVIRDTCENKNATIELQNVTEGFSRVLEQISVSSNLSSQNRSTIATVIIETIQSTILASLSKLDGNGSKRIETEQLGLELKAIEGGCNERNPLINLSAQQNQMRITCRTITGNRDQASIGVGFISFTDMNLILNGSFFKGSNTDSPETLRDFQVNSRVVSGQITSDKRSNFSEPVIFTLEHLKDKDNRQEVICVFWDSTEEAGSWSRQGCTLSNSNRTHTACSCTHLSIFSVIMAFKDVHGQDPFPLLVLTYVGLTFSLLCLSFAILTFLFCSSSRNTSTPMHLQLCICLFLAELLLLTGMDKTSNRIGCAIIAGLLQYFFLASFSWMFVEALMLFLTVRNLNVANYFNTRKIKTPHLCLFGYGFPLLIVIISAASKPDSYGTSKHCWLNSATGHVWSFLGPVCAFILINSTLFIITLVNLAKKLSSVNANVSTIKDTRLLTFKAGAQLLILGCTWIIGLFQIESAAQIMAYLFTIINSFQGAFILLVHCILNRQVREEYLRWFRRIHKPTRESQSSGITMSTAAVPLKSLKDGNNLTSGHSAVTQNTTSSSTVDWNSATAL